MKNTQIILSVIGGFILGFLLYKVIKKYQSSRVGSSTGTIGDTSVDTSTPTSSSTGIPIDPNSVERISYKKTYRNGGDTNIATYGRGGRASYPVQGPKKECAEFNTKNECIRWRAA